MSITMVEIMSTAEIIFTKPEFNLQLKTVEYEINNTIGTLNVLKCSGEGRDSL